MSLQQQIDALEPLAFHNVPVQVLKNYCNPLGCWPELKKAITKKEVEMCLREGKEALAVTPDAMGLAITGADMDAPEWRENHIKKIAYFVKHEPTKSISLDVGVPSLNCYVGYYIVDGNHRFAGAIIGGQKTIQCNISGSIEHIKELGLWYPNDSYLALEKLYDLQYENENTNRENEYSMQ